MFRLKENYMRQLISLFAALFLVLGLVLPAAAGTFTPAQEEEMQNLVHKYLMEHPEILRDMASALDIKDKKHEAEARSATLAGKSKDIFHNPGDAVVGNDKGDVTVVEFMDYNCGWCKKGVAELQSIVGSDKKVRVVVKEFPIFGEGSEYAAKAALASVKQGKYWEFHQALFATEGKVTPQSTDATAKSIGIDVAKMKADMKDPAIAATMAKNQELAAALLITGTPGFIIDETLFPGYEPKDALLAAIANVRANGGCKLC
jgi:protein-disulfide isomerase